MPPHWVFREVLYTSLTVVQVRPMPHQVHWDGGSLVVLVVIGSVVVLWLGLAFWPILVAIAVPYGLYRVATDSYAHPFFRWMSGIALGAIILVVAGFFLLCWYLDSLG